MILGQRVLFVIEESPLCNKCKTAKKTEVGLDIYESAGLRVLLLTSTIKRIDLVLQGTTSNEIAFQMFRRFSFVFKSTAARILPIIVEVRVEIHCRSSFEL